MNAETLNTLFTVVIIPLLGALTTFVIKFLNAKSKDLKVKVENETAKKYIDMITSTIQSCVIATNQTYVESLKASGGFDIEAQKEAFRLTYEAVIKMLSVEALEYIATITGDTKIYLTNLIESQVNANK